MAATARCRTPEGSFVLAVRDISVGIDNLPGGLGLSIDATAARRLPLASWAKGKAFELHVEISTQSEPIKLAARLAGTPRPGARRNVLLGVQYTAVRPEDTSKLQSFWIACQRGRRARDKKR